MASIQSRVTAQGQISVPADIRRRFGIGPGSVLEWEEDGDRIVVRPVGEFTSEDIHRAVFGDRPPVRRTLAELKQGIRKYMKQRRARD
jgi:AbrB family looped-hinge helix DNA binding protein